MVTVYVDPRGDRAMHMRFCSGITRGQEKWVKLALGHFFVVTDRKLPRAFHSKARSHSPITTLGGGRTADRNFQAPSAIVSVIFGARMPESDRVMITQALRHQPDINFKEARLKEGKFLIEIWDV